MSFEQTNSFASDSSVQLSAYDRTYPLFFTVETGLVTKRLGAFSL